MKCRGPCKRELDADKFRPYRNKWGDLRRRYQCRECEAAAEAKRDREYATARKKGIRGDAYRNRYLIIKTPDGSYPTNGKGHDVYFFRSELEAMIAEGNCLTPGTILEQKGVRYKVTGNLKAWEDFANEDYPLDCEMPAQRLERVT